MAPDSTSFLVHRLTMGRTVAWVVAVVSVVALLDFMRTGKLAAYGSGCLLYTSDAADE